MKLHFTFVFGLFSLISFGQGFNDASDLELEPLDFPILKDTVYRVGVYETFLSFRNNAPSIERPIEKTTIPRSAKNWVDTYEVRPRYVKPDGERERVKKAWGFYDGKNLYVNWQGEFYPLEKHPDHFTFWGHMPVNENDPATTAVWGMAGAMGGIIGGAIAGAITGVVVGSQRANSRQEYRIDMLTGKVWEAPLYQPTAIHPFKIILYYFSPEIENKEALNIVLKNRSDSTSSVLKANGFLEFSWTDIKSDIKVCIQGQTENCFAFLPKLNQTNYLEYVPASKKSPKGTFKPVPEKEADFYLKRIRYAQENAQKRQARNEGQ